MRSSTPPLYYRRPDGPHLAPGAHVMGAPHQHSSSALRHLSILPPATSAIVDATRYQGVAGSGGWVYPPASAPSTLGPGGNALNINQTVSPSLYAFGNSSRGGSSTMPMRQSGSGGGSSQHHYQVATSMAGPLDAPNSESAFYLSSEGRPRAPTPSVPPVMNPFFPAPGGNAPHRMPASRSSEENCGIPSYLKHPASFLRDSASSWTAQSHDDAHRLSALDSEEASLALEEQQLKAQLLELHQWRQRVDEEQNHISRGWAEMLEQETRYHTEPLVNLSREIDDKERRCRALMEHLHVAQSHLDKVQTQLRQYDYVHGEQMRLKDECERLARGFLTVEQRRKACVAKAGLYFDCESKREGSASMLVRQLDQRIHELTASGALASVMFGGSRSTSRGTKQVVSFAAHPHGITDKSFVIDGSRGPSLSGMTAADGTTTSSAAFSERAGLTVSSTNHTGANGSDDFRDMDESICLGLGDDSISGPSIAFSLNNIKRPRLEPVA